MKNKMGRKLAAATQIIALIAAASTAGFSSHLQAQELAPQEPAPSGANGDSTDYENARWYQVEVILFSYLNPTTDERWPKDIALNYSDNWAILSDTQNLNSDALGDSSTAALNSPTTTFGSKTQASETALTPDLSATPAPISFKLLPKAQRKLNDAALQLSWAKDTHILFHQAWIQPVTDRQQSPDILISAGKQYGNHFELEGSINLSVSRYLHITTNLWFTQFVDNVGQPQAFWPELPTRPDQRTAEVMDIRLGYSNKDGWRKSQGQATTGLLVEPTTTDTGFDIDSSANTSLLSSQRQNFSSEPYLVKNIALVQQKRRMRSRELHYIDHPLVGMVIWVEPLNSEVTAEPEAAVP